MAKEWGVSKESNGYTNIYKIETDGLVIFDLNSDEYTILHWLTVLLENRIFDIGSALAQEAKEYRPVANRSPEYWAGWALAYYQWQTNLSFKQIDSFISITEVLAMYNPYHEIDISQFCDRMTKLYNSRKQETNLKKVRLAAGLSQSKLAEVSGIPVRTIRQYEQKVKNLNAAKAESVIALSKALECSVEQLMEI